MTTTRRPRTHATALDQPFTLTASHAKMLEALHRYRYLTAPLLGVAYGAENGDGRGLKHVRNELGRLFHHGYVARHPTPLSGHGSEQYVYTLSKRGARAILEEADYAAARHHVYNRESPQRHYEHHIALSTLQLILDLGGQDWTLARFRSDERRERFRAALGDGREVPVQPDAWATIRHRDGQQTLYLFEVDLASKNNARTEDRCAAYALHLTRELDRLKKREGVNNAVAVFVEPDEDQIKRMLTVSIRTFATLGLSRRSAPLFLFWNMEDWFEPKEFTRRQHVGTAAERTRRWTVPWLRSPREILTEPSLANVRGESRLLVQSTADHLGGAVAGR
jgi:hypothetical protein